MSKLAEILRRARRSLGYHQEKVVLDFTSDIARMLEHKNITRAELARRIDSSPAYVTKLLRGNANPTVKTMVEVAYALNSRIDLNIVPIEQFGTSQAEWKTVGSVQFSREPRYVVSVQAANEGQWAQLQAA